MQTRAPSLPARALRAREIENPGPAENVWIGYAFTPITFVELVAVLVGSATPSVTWDIVYAPTRNAGSPTSVLSSPQTTTDVAGGDLITTFANAVVPMGNHVWLVTSAASGVVDKLDVGGLVRGLL